MPCTPTFPCTPTSLGTQMKCYVDTFLGSLSSIQLKDQDRTAMRLGTYIGEATAILECISNSSSTVTLQQAYVNGASSPGGRINLDATGAGIQLVDAATPLASFLFAVHDNTLVAEYFRVDKFGARMSPLAATGGSTIKDSPPLTLRSKYWTGSASANWDAQIKHVQLTTTPTSKVSLTFDAIEKSWIDNAGTFQNSGGRIIRNREATTSPVTVAGSDNQISVNRASAGATAVNLPAAPDVGRIYVVQDGKGDAATNAITVSPAVGLINGSATFVINTNYGGGRFVYDGAKWTATYFQATTQTVFYQFMEDAGGVQTQRDTLKFSGDFDLTDSGGKTNVALTFQPVLGTGTTNFLPRWTNSTTLGDSVVKQNGTALGVNVSGALATLAIGSVGSASHDIHTTRTVNFESSVVGSFNVSISMIGKNAFGSDTGTGTLLAVGIASAWTGITFSTSASERARFNATGFVMNGANVITVGTSTDAIQSPSGSTFNLFSQQTSTSAPAFVFDTGTSYGAVSQPIFRFTTAAGKVFEIQSSGSGAQMRLQGYVPSSGAAAGYLDFDASKVQVNKDFVPSSDFGFSIGASGAAWQFVRSRHYVGRSSAVTFGGTGSAVGTCSNTAGTVASNSTDINSGGVVVTFVGASWESTPHVVVSAHGTGWTVKPGLVVSASSTSSFTVKQVTGDAHSGAEFSYVVIQAAN